MQLRSWIWAYFPHFRGHYVFDPASRCHAAAAIREGQEVPQGKDPGRLECIRRLLDGVKYEEVDWFLFTEVAFDQQRYAPSLFRGVLRAADFQEPYMPDRVLRQFRRVQGISDPPLAPLSVIRSNKLTHYKVEFEESLLEGWDAEPRPVIQLGERAATQFWDVSDDYLDWLEKYSHVLVDPRSIRQDRPHAMHPSPTVDTLVRNRMTAVEIRLFMVTPVESRPTDIDGVMSRLLDMLIGPVLPMAPPLCRASRVFRGS